MKTAHRLTRRILLVAAIAALFATRAGAATINTNGDTVDDEGVCSLRVVGGAVSTAINNGRVYVAAGAGGMSVLM